MPPSSDLDLPAGLSPEGRQAGKVLRAWAIRKHRGWTGGCRAFWTPAEWKVHENITDEALDGAVLVVLHDGGCFSLYDGGPWVADTDQDLARLGLYVEHLTNVASGVYPCPQRS